MKSTCKGALIVALPLLGCASHPPPSDHLASAVAATRGAQEGGAAQVPKAALHLKMAEEGITEARKMIANGDNERADYMTLRVYNDAELALALARADAARRRAEQTEASSAQASAPPTSAPQPRLPAVAPAQQNPQQ